MFQVLHYLKRSLKAAIGWIFLFFFLFFLPVWALFVPSKAWAKEGKVTVGIMEGIMVEALVITVEALVITV